MEDFHSYLLVITLFFMVVEVAIGIAKLTTLVQQYPQQKKTDEPTIGISVIICSRNDLDNLKKNLRDILSQEYSAFEVIVVDDASNDGTFAYLENLSKENPRLRPFRIDNKTTPGKKEALKLGIEHALLPFILLTDADCSPNSTKWMKSQATFASEELTVAVLGYGGYKTEKGFLNKLIRFDTAVIAINYMSAALFRKPYMGVGRNMGYSKELSSAMIKVNTNLASGDDDLFVQAVAEDAKFLVNLEPDSFTTSPAKNTWKTWMAQKGRHTTTAPKYTLMSKLTIGSQWLVNLCVILGIIILLLTGDICTGTMLLLLNSLYIAMFNGLWFSKLGEKDLILLAPLLNIIYTFVQPIFVIKSWGRKKEEWN